MPESGPVPVNQTDINIDVDAINAIPEREMETGDEYEGIWEADDLSDGDANVPGLSRAEKFPIRGRGNRHPVATFNDTTAFKRQILVTSVLVLYTIRNLPQGKFIPT